MFIHFYIVIDLICQETIFKNKNSGGTTCQSDCKRQELDAPPLPQHLTIQIIPCFSLRNVCLLLLFNLYTTVNLPLSFNSFREETIIFLKKLVKEKRVNQITERWSCYQLICYLNSTIVISLFSQLIRRGTSVETMGKTFSVFCIKKMFLSNL